MTAHPVVVGEERFTKGMRRPWGPRYAGVPAGPGRNGRFLAAPLHIVRGNGYLVPARERRRAPMPPDPSLPSERRRTGASRSASLLRDADFRRLWLAGGLGWTVRWLEILSVGLYALAVSGSPLVVASMMLARTLPGVLLGGFAGVLAECVDRRRLLAAGLAAMGLNAALLAVLAVTDALTLWYVAAGACLNGIFWCAEYPARRTLVADVAGLERLGNATSLDSATHHFTRLIGPLVGGGLFALLGLKGAYLLSVLLYAIAFVNVVALEGRGKRPPAVAPASLLRSLGQGFAHVRRNRLIAGTLAVTVILNFFGFPYLSMIPVVAEGELGLSPGAIGGLMSLDGLGALAGSLLLSMLVRPALFARVFAAGATLLLLMVLVFALSSYLPLSLLAMLLAGLGMSGFAAMQSAILLSHSPDQIRPRLMGVLMLCIGAGPIGLLHLGLLAEWLGAPRAVALSALEGLAALAVAMRVWPELRGRAAS